MQVPVDTRLQQTLALPKNAFQDFTRFRRRRHQPPKLGIFVIARICRRTGHRAHGDELLLRSRCPLVDIDGRDWLRHETHVIAMARQQRMHFSQSCAKPQRKVLIGAEYLVMIGCVGIQITEQPLQEIHGPGDAIALIWNIALEHRDKRFIPRGFPTDGHTQ